MKWRGNKFYRFLKGTYLKYYSTFSLNKNLLISGILGFLVSLVIAHFSAEYSTNFVLNSALTVISGFLTYKIIFAILFHIDNKQRYTKKLSGKIHFQKFKKILIKMLFASSVFDIVNNLSRFFILFELLRTHYSPIQAALISSIIASSLSYLAINLFVKYINVFYSTKKKIF